MSDVSVEVAEAVRRCRSEDSPDWYFGESGSIMNSYIKIVARKNVEISRERYERVVIRITDGAIKDQDYLYIRAAYKEVKQASLLASIEYQLKRSK